MRHYLTTLVAAILTGLSALAAPSAPPLPALPWVLPPAAPLRVQLVRGLWTPQYRLEEGLARAGAAVIDESWVADGAGAGWPGPGDQGSGGLTWYPDATGLMQHQVVIVSHVNAAAFGARQKELVEYVRHGGSVLFLGGRFAFGKQYKESAFAEMMPVTFPGGRWYWGSDLHPEPQGLPLKVGTDALAAGFAGLPWDQQPQLYWYHDVVPKEGAKVLLTAGEHPLLVVGTFGAGRVAVFAGTVMGDPPAGQHAFWTWPGWPGVVATTVQWLAASAKDAPHGLSASDRESLVATLATLGGGGDLETPAGEADPALTALLDQLVPRVHDRESVTWLLAQVKALHSDLPASVPAPLGEAARPFADATTAPLGTALVASGLPYKTALGLRLLGASQDAAALATLTELLKTGEPRVAKGGNDAPLGQGMDAGAALKAVLPAELARQSLAIRSGALAGLSERGAAGLPAIRQAVKDSAATGATKPKDYLDVIGTPQRQYQAALFASLRAGDDANAALYIDALLENVYIIARARTEGNKPKDRLKRVQDELASTVAWQDAQVAALPTLPDAVLPALAKRIAAESDWRVARLALALFAGRTGTPATAALAASPVPAVAALAAK